MINKVLLDCAVTSPAAEQEPESPRPAPGPSAGSLAG